MALGEAAGIEAKIKWPNDVCISGKKCSGILVEAGLRAGDLEWAVVGVGLNVNAVRDDFPAEMRDKVTSVYEESGRAMELNDLYAAILNSFDCFCRHLYSGREDLIVDYWAKASDLIGRTIQISLSHGTKIEGQAIGLNQNGHLIVKKAKGIEQIIEIGDILTFIDAPLNAIDSQ
jgi:BirA family biotin operon repressor/biotin-[acetyl-CoA-carboxylase] ligase